MGIYVWGSFGSTQQGRRTPRLTVRCEYEGMAPTEVAFSVSPSYGLVTARDAHAWFLDMMRKHEEFEVETDGVGEWPVPFSSDTVRWVMVE